MVCLSGSLPGWSPGVLHLFHMTWRFPSISWIAYAENLSQSKCTGCGNLWQVTGNQESITLIGKSKKEETGERDRSGYKCFERICLMPWNLESHQLAWMSSQKIPEKIWRFLLWLPRLSESRKWKVMGTANNMNNLQRNVSAGNQPTALQKVQFLSFCLSMG